MWVIQSLHTHTVRNIYSYLHVLYRFPIHFSFSRYSNSDSCIEISNINFSTYRSPYSYVPLHFGALRIGGVDIRKCKIQYSSLDCVIQSGYKSRRRVARCENRVAATRCLLGVAVHACGASGSVPNFANSWDKHFRRGTAISASFRRIRGVPQKYCFTSGHLAVFLRD